MPFPRFQFRLRTLLIVVAGIAICCAVVRLLVPVHSEWEINNALVGRSENDIISTYGQPSSEKPYYHQPGPGTGYTGPIGPTRTLIFDHVEGGTLWVWLSDHGSGWVCFESFWYADGVQF